MSSHNSSKNVDADLSSLPASETQNPVVKPKKCTCQASIVKCDCKCILCVTLTTCEVCDPVEWLKIDVVSTMSGCECFKKIFAALGTEF